MSDPMSNNCIFCGQPWAPDHAAYCRARPTEENIVARLQDQLGIPQAQRSDPLLRDVKRLRWMLKEQQLAAVRRIHDGNVANNGGIGGFAALVAYGFTWCSLLLFMVVGHGPFLTFVSAATSHGWPGDWPNGWATLWPLAKWSVNKWGDPENVLYAAIALFIVSPLLILWHKWVLGEIRQNWTR